MMKVVRRMILGASLILITLAVSPNIGWTGESEVVMKEGRIQELRLGAGMMVVNEVDIRLSKETSVMTIQEEELSLRALKVGMPVQVFLERRGPTVLEAVHINVFDISGQRK